MPKNKVVVVPILNNEYKVIVCWGSEKFTNNLGKKYHYEKNQVKLKSGARGTTWMNPKNPPIIVIPRYPVTPQEFGTLAHESVHAIDNIFNKIEENNTTEVFAHSIGAIVRTVLENYRRG